MPPSPALRASLLLSTLSQKSEFVRFAQVFPLKEFGFAPEPGWYLEVVGWVEVVAGLLLAFGPQLLQEISNFVLSVVMIGESRRAPAAPRGVSGRAQGAATVPTLCTSPRCHLHAAGAAGAAGHVRPRHALPRPPPAAQHPRARRPPEAQVRVTGGGKDGRLGWREAMLLECFWGWRGVSSPAAAGDPGAGCPHAAGHGLLLWDSGDVTGTASAAPLLNSHKVDWSAWNGHARLGLALLSWGLLYFGIKPLVFHILPPLFISASPQAEPRGLRQRPGNPRLCLNLVHLSARRLAWLWDGHLRMSRGGTTPPCPQRDMNHLRLAPLMSQISTHKLQGHTKQQVEYFQS